MITAKQIAEQRKMYGKPITVGNSLAVKVLTVRNKYFGILDGVAVPGRIMVDIVPGYVFGDGIHDTTQMCAEAIEQYVKPGFRVLDIGCGTGIQSVFALKLGADHAHGVDIDPAAVVTATKNATINGVQDRFSCSVGNLADGVDGTYDLIVANILADPVIHLLGTLHRLTHKDTIVVISGVRNTRCEDVEIVALENFEIIEKCIRGEWACYVMKPKLLSCS